MLEVCQAELVRVMGEVDGVHVPGNLRSRSRSKGSLITAVSQVLGFGNT